MLNSNQESLEVVSQKSLSFGVELLDHEAEAVNGGLKISAGKLSLNLKNFFFKIDDEGQVTVFADAVDLNADDLNVQD